MTNYYQELAFKIKQSQKENPEKKNSYKVELFTSINNAFYFQPWATKLKFFSPKSPKEAKVSVVDIYSLNYEISAQDKNVFCNKKKNKKIGKELANIPHEFYNPLQAMTSQKLLVLDIKTKEDGYSNKEVIQGKEQEFLSLFNQPNALPFVQQFNQLGLQYIFMEGSLKADLLGKGLFEGADENHLKSHSADFCQLVEFMINAFKRGEDVIIKNKSNGTEQTFSATDYIKKISGKIPDYQPVNISHTIYPKQYYQIAMDGTYTKAMRASGFFKITTTSNDETGIVQMTTQKMKG